MIRENFIGYIIGEASTMEFEFVTDEKLAPLKWDYLMVESFERREGKEFKVEILAQVSEIFAFSKNITIDTLPSMVKKQIEQNIVNPKIYGRAKVLGYIDKNTKNKLIRIPRRNRLPGEMVFRAPNSLLSEFFSKREDEGLEIGTLLTNSQVKLLLDPNGLNRHLAIIAQTGAGKSYTTGVIIEELFKLGGSILILDPHSDYVFLSQKAKDYSLVERSEYIRVFRNPNSTGRYSSSSIINLHHYEINFANLDEEDIAEICFIPGNAVRIKETIRSAIEKIDEDNYSPEKLIEQLEDMEKKAPNSKERSIIRSTIIRVRQLLRYKVFGNNDVPIEDIIKPWTISVLDLSGLTDKSMNYIAAHILQETYSYILNKVDFPIFIIIEEAHRFIPPISKKQTFCSRIINTIAAEGRKFGLFLILITQRPSKLDPNSLSQCNSQIIMKITNPEDQQAILKSSERATEELLNNLPALSPGEAIITGEIVKVPVMVSIRERITREGGADINILEKLRQAREGYEIEKESEEEEKSRINPRKNPFMR
ncbi:MAG: ATP-binding protein [Promethearchaeota archaeon]